MKFTGILVFFFILLAHTYINGFRCLMSFIFQNSVPFSAGTHLPPHACPLSLFCTFFRIALVDGRFEFCPLWRFFSSFSSCCLLTLTFTKWPLGDKWRRRISISISCHFRPCSVTIWTCVLRYDCLPPALRLPPPPQPQIPPSSPLFRRSQQEVGLACRTTKQQIEINLCNSRAA